MADIELVIKIPDGCYEELNNGQFPVQDAYRLVAWIKDGTPLPKGHGKLKDVDRFESHDEYDGQGFTKSVYKDDIDNLPTIIEADKAESEE